MAAGERIRILLVDDDQGAFLMTQAMLGRIESADFALDWIADAAEGREAILRREHDVYLVDYLIGDESGVELARMVRDEGVKAPIILLTGKGSHEVDVEAMEAGVNDYLDKTKVDPDLLERSIRYARERVRSEAALRDSEERHRSMFDHLPIGLFRTTVDGRLLDANPALVHMLGLPDRDTLEYVYARNFFVNPAQRQTFLDRIDHFGVLRGFESEIERPGGGTLRVRVAARPHRAPDGTTLYFEGAVEDVTDEYEARDLHGRAARFSWVFDHSGLAIVLLERGGEIRGANPAFLRAFEYALPEIQGKAYTDLVDEGDREAATEELARVATGAVDSSASERRYIAADGTVLWARTRTGLVRDLDGHPDHLIVLLEDVAEA